MLGTVSYIEGDVLEVAGSLLKVTEFVLVVDHSLDVSLHELGGFGDFVLGDFEVVVLDAAGSILEPKARRILTVDSLSRLTSMRIEHLLHLRPDLWLDRRNRICLIRQLRIQPNDGLLQLFHKVEGLARCHCLGVHHHYMKDG